MTPGDETTIGFMGVGSIGRPIAERILDHHRLVVCDVNPAARLAFEGRAKVVGSARELGEATQLVFACLPSVESYEKAILGPDGLFAAGRVRCLVHIGTTGPELVAAMVASADQRGISIVDAPVSGGPSRARSGELMVMAAGSRDSFTSVEPVIGCYASSIVYLGEKPGLAQTMKLINNMLSAANLAVACEVMVLGVKAGLDPKQMLAVLNGGTGQNSATLTKIPDHLLPRKFDYGGRLEIVYKDLAMFVRQATHFGLSAPLSSLIASTYAAAIEHEGSDADMTTVIRQMERAAGVEVGP